MIILFQTLFSSVATASFEQREVLKEVQNFQHWKLANILKTNLSCDLSTKRKCSNANATCFVYIFYSNQGQASMKWPSLRVKNNILE